MPREGRLRPPQNKRSTYARGYERVGWEARESVVEGTGSEVDQHYYYKRDNKLTTKLETQQIGQYNIYIISNLHMTHPIMDQECNGESREEDARDFVRPRENRKEAVMIVVAEDTARMTVAEAGKAAEETRRNNTEEGERAGRRPNKYERDKDDT